MAIKIKQSGKLVASVKPGQTTLRLVGDWTKTPIDLTPLAGSKVTNISAVIRDGELPRVKLPAAMPKLKKLRVQGEITNWKVLAAYPALVELETGIEASAPKFKEYGPVKVFEPEAGEPWTIFQDLVDELCVDDQNDVEELVSAAFKKSSKALHAKVAFDSEGDAFVATSSDKAAIVALAKLIQALIREA